jgi:pyruvate formate lyase activating enzyme
MGTRVLRPPPLPPRPDGSKDAGWWHARDDGRIECDLCPRRCALREGDRGFCFVRQNVQGSLVLTTYGRSTGFCVDPIEKKPIFHFHPGPAVLSFGTAGCNLGCKFCQNWTISKSREVQRASDTATPEAIAQAARNLGCQSVAFTYNDPVIWAEYAIDVAKQCHLLGVKTVAVTAGYISPEARGDFFTVMDAANVDLKGFTEDFYQHFTLSHLQPVLDTLRWLRAETGVWLEITNLLIPGANDDPAELCRMFDWIVHELGDDVPVHLTAFHPDFRLRDRPSTPPATLRTARGLAQECGLKHVYTGNVPDDDGQSTYCPSCGRKVIGRSGYTITSFHLSGGRCTVCGHQVAGHFDPRPGDWGPRRMPVEIGRRP